jgi:hypothetical protein
MDIFGKLHMLKTCAGGTYSKVRVDDDLTKENRDKQQAMLKKRRDMLEKKEAEAVVVRNLNMEPVMVAKIGGEWKVVTARPPGGKWDPDQALSYAWDKRNLKKSSE